MAYIREDFNMKNRKPDRYKHMVSQSTIFIVAIFFIVYIYMHNWNLWKCDIPASINYTHIEIYKRLMRYYITTVFKATWGLFQFKDHLPRYRDSIIKTSEWVFKFNSLSRTADSWHQYPCIIKMREWYFYNGNSSTGKRASLYWNSPQLYERERD